MFYLFNWDLFIVVVCLDLLFEVFEESIFLVVMYGMFMMGIFKFFFGSVSNWLKIIGYWLKLCYERSELYNFLEVLVLSF